MQARISVKVVTGRDAIGSVPVSPAHEPEIPTNAEWRALMRAARKRKKLSQGALGRLVGVSQAQISDIETGQSLASSVILAICRELDIDPPVVTENQLQRRWIEAGRVLAVRSPTAFRRQLEFVEGLVADLAADEDGQSGNS
jgi:putative transcriptional regulator